MLAIFWPLVFAFTGICYSLLLLFLPFNQAAATVMLFAIISFWSRLPGVGIPHPFYVLYMADFVDFFSLIIAINVGGLTGGIFAFSINILSRLSGVYPDWITVSKDAIAQFFVCLIIPFIYIAIGGDIFLSMIWYSVLRMFMFFPLRILPNKYPFPQAVVNIILGGIGVLIVNAAYARLFGGYFDSLLQGGFRFNWLLFLFVTAVILYVGLKVMGRKPKKRRVIPRRLEGWLNLRLYLLKNSALFKKLRLA